MWSYTVLTADIYPNERIKPFGPHFSNSRPSPTDIIFLTISAVIAGTEGWEDIEDFGEYNLQWLRRYGDFKQGIPVHDTIARVINLISASNYSDALLRG